MTYQMEDLIAMTQKRFSIPVSGMTCHSCASKIERAVRGGHGVTRAMVDFKGSKVLVEMDSMVGNTSQIIAAVKGEGYSAGEPKEM